MEPQSIFLLGGHDLEMNLITGLLEERHLIYKDRSLQWHNAYLSQYEGDIQAFRNNSLYRIYGIELQEDIPLPDNYIRIDHHNQYARLPSALEQVSELLHHPLNKYQQLVAANDKAYIPGMIAAGATQKEIKRIRLEDRKAQGVTEEDERLAEKAIQENLEKKGGLILVRAFTPRFSPICDRLYPYNQLLIYTTEELIFYGKGVAMLTEKFTQELSAGRMFHGGGPEGYLGSKRNVYTPLELQTIINQIKQYVL